MDPTSLAAVPPGFPLPFALCRIGTTLRDMPRFPTVVAKSVIGLAFAFTLKWLWAPTSIVTGFATVEAALAFALAFAAF